MSTKSVIKSLKAFTNDCIGPCYRIYPLFSDNNNTITLLKGYFVFSIMIASFIRLGLQNNDDSNVLLSSSNIVHFSIAEHVRMAEWSKALRSGRSLLL